MNPQILRTITWNSLFHLPLDMHKPVIANGLSVLHLELDQYPERHVYTIAAKPI